ncbi:MAG: hypothetical protein L6422_07195 [Candidatus Marinimicrobia bacterium]|nr:hypothetical protein [Candidatus Neomarinimicrobiota bacterium]
MKGNTAYLSLPRRESSKLEQIIDLHRLFLQLRVGLHKLSGDRAGQ